MATTLGAVGRIVIPYTFSGISHALRVYVRNPQVVGGTYNINSRTLDENDEDWTLCADDLATAFSYVAGTDWVFGQARLELRDGLLWSIGALHTLSMTNHAVSSAPYATQFTLVLRDILFRKVKVVALETVPLWLNHDVSWAGMVNANEKAFAREFLSNHVLTHAPYIWMVGRGNQYLNLTGFVGATASVNRRIRRRRGLT